MCWLHAEARLLEKQLWVTGIVSGKTEADVQNELNHLYGGVLQVRFTYNNNAAASKPGAGLLSLVNGFDRQYKPPIPRAIVEFTEARYAKAVLAARQQVYIFCNRNGQRSSQQQLVLPAGSVGYLKKPCSCRRYGRTCNCEGYVR